MKLFKTGLILLLISFVLAGSAGLPVFNHFCNTSGESSTSVFIQDNHCETEKEVKSCCAEKQEKDNDCCSDETVVYKVKFDFFEHSELNFAPFVVPCIHNEFLVDLVVLPTEENTNKVAFEDPDPPSGREILLFHSVLRI